MTDTDAHTTQPRPAAAIHAGSVLAWPAWLRVLVVLPAVLVLWLAVAWAGWAMTW